jgi:hypothetical protein
MLLILGVSPLHANWGSGAGGSIGTGGLKAFGTTQVEMQNEDLSIQLYRDRAKVHVSYALRNTGDAVDVRAGFPCLAIRSKSKSFLEIEDYRLTADERGVPYHIEKGNLGNWKTLFDSDFMKMAEGAPDEEEDETGAKPPADLRNLWWLVSTVHFEKGETKKIDIRYESLYEESSGGYSDDSTINNGYFRYLLSTAAAWKGPIQKGKVTLEAVTIDPKSITIKPRDRFHQTPAGFVWEFTDLVPTMEDNIEVCMNDKSDIIFNYAADNPDEGNASWYSFEGNKYYFNFHGYTATASSEQPGHPAKDVGDYHADTAWVAGKKGGIDESITLTLSKPEHVDQIGLIPGFSKSKTLYFANNRVQELEVEVNGKHQVTATLPDEYISFGPYSKKGYELIDLGDYFGEAKTITLRVKGIYPGTKYNDTCISEVLLRKRLKNKPEVRGAR